MASFLSIKFFFSRRDCTFFIDRNLDDFIQKLDRFIVCTSLTDIVFHTHALTNVSDFVVLGGENEKVWIFFTASNGILAGWLDSWFGWLSCNIQMNWWTVIMCAHCVHCNTILLYTRAHQTNDDDDDNVQKKYLQLCHMNFPIDTMTHPHNIKEEKSWSPLNEMERNVNRGIWKLELLGFW